MLIGKTSKGLGYCDSGDVSENIDHLNDKYTHREFLDLKGSEKSAIEVRCYVVNDEKKQYRAIIFISERIFYNVFKVFLFSRCLNYTLPFDKDEAEHVKC